MQSSRQRFSLIAAFFSLLNFLHCGVRTDQDSTAAKNTYEIHIVSVEDWGGTPPTGTYGMHELHRITLHHSGEDFKKGRDPQEYLRTLQKVSRFENKWIDVPYHFMIDLEGNIYAARNPDYPGDTNTAYDPAGHLLTCLIGNYENSEPTDGQIEALINLMAWQCAEFSIDPATLKGHRDLASTACPGEHLYSYVEKGYLVRKIKERTGNVAVR